MGNYFMHADNGLKMIPESEIDTSLNNFLVNCESSCESSVIESEGASTSQQEILDFDTVSIGSPDDVWTLEFDDSYSSTESGAGIVLISPKGNLFLFSFKLQFNNTNNTTEYESLLLGMKVAQQKGIKNLHAQGDAELIVCQIRNIYQTRSEKLRHYRNLVWDLIETFDAFDISVVSCEFNDRADSLAVSATSLIPHKDFLGSTYVVELVFRPGVPDSIAHTKHS
ncbi:uncharacterized protein LOC131035876 [Cryptomeria japonica]|uniref:uncharacterized protein LOC131035876 n=1 Tax=Cryptomeria japonica TaxID=3369 RepID=UPI0027DA75DF|nr:uncharacterized protein LOC131035876 [Cryptomeria japonica]